jgi:hypothetical protein
VSLAESPSNRNKRKGAHLRDAIENSNKRNCILYVQNVKLKTVRDIYAEYDTGYNGGPALRELEQKHKGWRAYRNGRAAWNRRIHIINEVTHLIADGMSRDDAISDVQRRVDAFPKKGKSQEPDLQGFNAALKDTRKNQEVPDPAPQTNQRIEEV